MINDLNVKTRSTTTSKIAKSSTARFGSKLYDGTPEEELRKVDAEVEAFMAANPEYRNAGKAALRYYGRR